jgi:hypothetical protein
MTISETADTRRARVACSLTLLYSVDVVRARYERADRPHQFIDVSEEIPEFLTSPQNSSDLYF